MTDRAVFEVLGWPDEGPTVRLDHREFAYAGKFVLSRTGVAVLRTPETDPADLTGREDYARGVLAAVSFDADRTDPSTLVLRYVSVRGDHRGEGLGPRLVREFLATVDRHGDDGPADRAFKRARIAVNNPYAYEALHRAGFAYTGETTGIAELVLERPVETPAPTPVDRYRAGLDRLAERDLDEAERSFVERQRAAGPPAVTEE